MSETAVEMPTTKGFHGWLPGFASPLPVGASAPSGPDVLGPIALHLMSAGGAGAPAPKKILIVDDDPDILESFTRLLAYAVKGIEIRTAKSGVEALAAIRQEAYAAIISDYRMPGMDGLEFLKQAHALQPAASRVLVTAYPDMELEKKAAAELGRGGFLTKEADPGHIIRWTQAATAA